MAKRSGTLNSRRQPRSIGFAKAYLGKCWTVEGEGSPGTVPAAFIVDKRAPTGIRFECAACGWAGCHRVAVRRVDGTHYQTEFAACDACLVIYHWPRELPTKGRPGGPAGGLSPTYMAPMAASGDHALTEEQRRAIQEAAGRARKGRSWRARRR